MKTKYTLYSVPRFSPYNLLQTHENMVLQTRLLSQRNMTKDKCYTCLKRQNIDIIWHYQKASNGWFQSQYHLPEQFPNFLVQWWKPKTLWFHGSLWDILPSSVGFQDWLSAKKIIITKWLINWLWYLQRLQRSVKGRKILWCID